MPIKLIGQIFISRWWQFRSSRARLASVQIDTQTLQALCLDLKANNVRIRRRAVRALKTIQHPQTIKPLCEATNDTDVVVCMKAVSAIKKALISNSQEVREQTSKELIKQGRRAVKPLWEIWETGDAQTREMAIYTLGQIKDMRVIHLLCTALGDGAPAVREAAASALVKIGSLTLESLWQVVEKGETPARRKAVEVLSRIDDVQVVGPLFRALQDTDAWVGWQAQRVLTKIGPPAIIALCQALEDSRSATRAKKALVAIGSPAVEAVCGVLANGNEVARINAAGILGEIRDARAISPLCQALADAPVSEQVQGILMEMGEPAVEAVCLVLKHKSRVARHGAVRILGHIRDARAVEPLCQTLEDTRELMRIRGLAAWSLGQIGARRAVEPLCRQLIDPLAHVRECAATALGKIADPQAVELLYLALEDQEPAVRERAVEALEQMGRREVLSVLRARLHPLTGEHSLSVRVSIHIAISKIEKKTETTKGLPRAAPAEMLNSSGLLRMVQDIPTPEGRPRAE